MTVLRLYFRNDGPLDVKGEHLIDLRSGNNRIEVNVNYSSSLTSGRKKTMTLLPKKAEMVKRKKDSNIDLHGP